MVSSLEKIGFEEIHGAINQFVALSTQAGQWTAKRLKQEKLYLSTIAEQKVIDLFKKLPAFKDVLNESYNPNNNLYLRIKTLQQNLASIINKLEDKST
jgi:putative protein kinase ArgK-like GTPase of G3E family